MESEISRKGDAPSTAIAKSALGTVLVQSHPSSSPGNCGVRAESVHKAETASHGEVGEVLVGRHALYQEAKPYPGGGRGDDGVVEHGTVALHVLLRLPVNLGDKKACPGL